jgi:thioesterase domain-containing protein
MQDAYQLNATDTVLQKTPFSFDVSVWEFFWPLLTGSRLVLAQPGGHRDNAYLIKLINSKQITTLHFVPSMLQAFLEAVAVETCRSLRRVICSGETLSVGLQRRFFERFNNCELHNLYGPTEAAVDVTYWQCKPDDESRTVPIGKPIANLKIYLLDRRGQPVPVGVVGELHISGVGLGRGYLERPQLSAERFIPDPFSAERGSRLYRTGDIARYMADGNIEFLGRMDHQVKVRGFRIELGEIESVLSSHPEITESVVLVQEGKQGDKRLVAYIVSENKTAISELREYLRERLPEYMIPAVFIVLDAIPLTPNGKIDRRALPAPDQARPELGEGFVAPRTAVEQKVAGIWEELLDVRSIGVRDDFFSLGGHSLLAVRVMARIQASFGQHLPLASLFQGATIEKQASLLHEQPREQSASALVSIQPKGEEVPFFCVHPGGGNVLCYRELSNHLGFERPFYGLQARGLDENQVPQTRIEDMAAYYIAAIRSVQPDGPYLLGGWSMGGVVAYEMAQQLGAQGQQVSLLALMDSRPFIDDAAPLEEITLLVNFARDLGLSVDGLKFSTDELAKLDSEELLSYVLQRAMEAGIVPQDIQLAHARRLFEVFKINVRAMQSYRPQPSSTRVTLLKAEQATVETPDETMGWGALTSGKVEIHTVPGSHFTIVREPYVRSLAEQLADCINKATLQSFASHT